MTKLKYVQLGSKHITAVQEKYKLLFHLHIWWVGGTGTSFTTCINQQRVIYLFIFAIYAFPTVDQEV